MCIFNKLQSDVNIVFCFLCFSKRLEFCFVEANMLATLDLLIRRKAWKALQQAKQAALVNQ